MTEPVLLTGASGQICVGLARAMAEAGIPLRLTDRVPFPDPLPPGTRFTQGELADPALLRGLAQGCRAVVHLGGISGETGFARILRANILGAHHALEAARLARCGFIYAGSNHAIGMHPAGTDLPVRCAFRPDGYYGLSKAFGELQVQAHHRRTGLPVTSVRIGSCFPEPEDAAMRRTWLAPADMHALVLRALDATGSHHIWGVSANPGLWWHHDDRDRIGWTPRDGTGRFPPAPPNPDPVSRKLTGGDFAAFGYHPEEKRRERDMAKDRPVLLTGASGALGRMLARELSAAAVRLVLTDIAPFPDALPPGSRFEQADLEDGIAILRLAESCRAILHFGGVSVERPFEEVIGPNIRGLYHVYEAARRERARVLFASSNHAIGFHERSETLDITCALRPDGYYGLSKAYGELMGRLYWDKHGVESVVVRIGSCFPEPRDARMLHTWLSYPDLARLCLATLAAPEVGYARIWGVGDNPDAWWVEDDRARIGWQPHDGTAPFRDALAGKTSDDAVAERFQGGAFCSMGYSRGD
ncbi:NAD-dependent epimerase/dehydratase family protein [Sabulicella rubraurantiaca]|uniref:NAD-dependent epimerase/dehydratase family protein n=1 Tax=Sabulicella rubraurantiaca TaxID=2811429 RepID=UPI001A96E997|nr:NAD(P)-dependent oxidoreductase [Sabulicella rubraurantiaca]